MRRRELMTTKDKHPIYGKCIIATAQNVRFYEPIEGYYYWLNKRILGEESEEFESFKLEYLETMFIDGFEIEPTREYFFEDEDEHTIVYVFKESEELRIPMMFSHCEMITKIDFTYIDTSNIGNLEMAFNCCERLRTIVGMEKFNTENVKHFNYLFSDTQLGTINVSNFNTSNATNMQCMFSQIYQPNRPVDYVVLENIIGYEDFDTSNVIYMGGMFEHVNLKRIDISKWDASNVTDMYGMFLGCDELTTVIMPTKMNVNSKYFSMMLLFSDCKKLTSVTMMGQFNQSGSVTDMFNNVTTTGTFYYNKNYDYSKIIAELPSTWTAVAI